MFLAVHIDALPAQLFNGDERLVDVSVFGDKVRPEVQGEAFRVEDVGRCLGKVCIGD